MSTGRAAAIARSFGRAALSYDAAAILQRRVADSLARRIAALALPARLAVLEIGCGTGLLTHALAARLTPECYVATDIAHSMVQVCRDRYPAPYRSHAVMDGEAACVGTARFDLICASLAVQWFADPAASLARLHDALRPGGVLAIATLGPGSLGEWRLAHTAAGCAAPALLFPPQSSLTAAWPGAATIDTEAMSVRHDSALAFLRSLRAIGADVPQAGAMQLSPGKMRRVLARFDLAGAVARYEVVFAFLWKA